MTGFYEKRLPLIQTVNSVVRVDLFTVPGILTRATFLNSQNANLN